MKYGRQLVLSFTLPLYTLLINESMKTFGVRSMERFLDFSRIGGWLVFESKHEFKH